MYNSSGSKVNRIEDDLLSSFGKYPDKFALIAGSEALSYRDLFQRSFDFSKRLTAMGVVPGDRVTVFLDKTPDAVIAFYAVWLAGAILVPAYEGLHVRQLRHILTHSATKLLISNSRKLMRLGDGISTEVSTLSVDLSSTTPESKSIDSCGLLPI